MTETPIITEDPIPPPALSEAMIRAYLHGHNQLLARIQHVSVVVANARQEVKDSATAYTGCQIDDDVVTAFFGDNPMTFPISYLWTSEIVPLELDRRTKLLEEQERALLAHLKAKYEPLPDAP